MLIVRPAPNHRRRRDKPVRATTGIAEAPEPAHEAGQSMIRAVFSSADSAFAEILWSTVAFCFYLVIIVQKLTN
jgi:hypothetical protein